MFRFHNRKQKYKNIISSLSVNILIQKYIQLIGYVRAIWSKNDCDIGSRQYIVLNFLRKGTSLVHSLWFSSTQMMNYSLFVFDISSVENIHEISSFHEYISIHYEGKVRWNKISYVDFIQPCSIRAVCIM